MWAAYHVAHRGHTSCHTITTHSCYYYVSLQHVRSYSNTARRVYGELRTPQDGPCWPVATVHSKMGWATTQLAAEVNWLHVFRVLTREIKTDGRSCDLGLLYIIVMLQAQ